MKLYTENSEYTFEVASNFEQVCSNLVAYTFYLISNDKLQLFADYSKYIETADDEFMKEYYTIRKIDINKSNLNIENLSEQLSNQLSESDIVNEITMLDFYGLHGSTLLNLIDKYFSDIKEDALYNWILENKNNYIEFSF